MKKIIIIAPWSSGSTAVAGWMQRLGASTCPPHQLTNDPLTPDSHEPKALRDQLIHYHFESSLTPTGRDLNQFYMWFDRWIKNEERLSDDRKTNILVIKHALLAFHIKRLSELDDFVFCLITRPLERIESTRKRRGWHPVYGAAGAKKIYSIALNTFIQLSLPFETIAFHHFCKNENYRQELAKKLGLLYRKPFIDTANSWLRVN